MTVPRDGAYPRPWTSDTNPEQADVLIVGASSAKTFHAVDVGNHDQFLDALWNRNGQRCRAMYDAATKKPSPTRANLDRLSELLAARGLNPLQTNVTCASARYDADVPDEDRAHGTELFKTVVAHVPWKAMIVYGAGAISRFGRALDVTMPQVPSPESAPVWTTVQGRPAFISPTLAFPSYRATVWPYIERVVASIADGRETQGTTTQQQPYPTLAARPVPTQKPREDHVLLGTPGRPATFVAGRGVDQSQDNCLSENSHR